MRSRRILFILSFLFLSWLPVGARAASSPVTDLGGTLSDEKWAETKHRFEDDIAKGAETLDKELARKISLQKEIAELQGQTAVLRRETQQESNVFKEIKLKGMLSDLKDKLEGSSKLDRDIDAKRGDLEQKCLSLIALENDRIEARLMAGESAQSDSLDSKLNDVTVLVRDRNRVQALLQKYRKKEDVENVASLRTAVPLDTNDHETLQLTLDLFTDRRKNLQEQLDRWSLEEEGLRNEVKLQGEMQDFLDDIQKLNSDSSLPQANLKGRDLETMVGASRKRKLSVRLTELRQKIKKGQQTLAQMDQLIGRVKERLDSLKEGKRP